MFMVFYLMSSTVHTNVIFFISVKPTYPVLEVDNSQLLEVTSDEETPVKCVVAAARPAVGIRWFLGDKDVTVMAETEETPTDNEVGGCIRLSLKKNNNNKKS